MAIQNTQAWLLDDVASDVGMGTVDKTGTLFKLETGELAMLYPNNTVQIIDNDYNPIGERYIVSQDEADAFKSSAVLGTF